MEQVVTEEYSSLLSDIILNAEKIKGMSFVAWQMTSRQDYVSIVIDASNTAKSLYTSLLHIGERSRKDIRRVVYSMFPKDIDDSKPSYIVPTIMLTPDTDLDSVRQVSTLLNGMTKEFDSENISKESFDDSYSEEFEKIKNAINNGKVKKVVLSRRQTFSLKENETSYSMFRSLCRIPRGEITWIAKVDNYGTWICSTPELLLRKQDNKFETVALAGTMPYSENSENKPVTEVWNEKNIKEQGIVRDTITDKLNSLGADNIEVNTSTTRSGALMHLKSEISFKSEVSIEDIIMAISPTPAVSGYPINETVQLISSVEGSDRLMYGGYLGFDRLDDSAEIYVNLRIARVKDNKVILYGGGGIMPESDELAEWTEAQMKMYGTLFAMRRRKK